MRSCLLDAPAVACQGASASAAAPDARDLTARMEITLDGFRDRYASPDATKAIVVPDGTIATAAAGLAGVEAGRATTHDTSMVAASIGKSLVAATLLALESEGLAIAADR
jgi:D-alanyl-D-alanine carboxypeptidase